MKKMVPRNRKFKRSLTMLRKRFKADHGGTASIDYSQYGVRGEETFAQRQYKPQD
jgi:hypothetical protein